MLLLLRFTLYDATEFSSSKDYNANMRAALRMKERQEINNEAYAFEFLIKFSGDIIIKSEEARRILDIVAELSQNRV